jgi:hypothetical protein
MENIYEALRESHELRRKLCRQLMRIKPGTSRAIETFRALRIELAAHAAAEERYLYAPILMDDRGLDSPHSTGGRRRRRASYASHARMRLSRSS